MSMLPSRVLPMIMLAAAACAGAAAAQSPGRDADTKPVKQINIYVTPYYASAKTLDGHPSVAVNTMFDIQLSSNKREDILAVRDAIQAQSQLITPMTLMVLARAVLLDQLKATYVVDMADRSYRNHSRLNRR